MKTITTLLIIFAYSIGFGQNFTGKIIDQQNKPISFANIIAKNNTNNSTITGVISDENGEFTFNTQKSNIYLEISCVGFVTN